MPPQYRSNPLDKLKVVGICLIVVSILGVLNIVAGMVIRIVGGQDVFDFENPEVIGVWAATIFIPMLNLAVLFGGINMLRGKAFASCMAAGIIAVIPLCTPCVVLGIPFGIWALIVLNQPDVKAAFQS